MTGNGERIETSVPNDWDVKRGSYADHAAEFPDAQYTPPAIYFRLDDVNPAHMRLSLFLNGGHAGQVCIRNEELSQLLDCWRGGWQDAHGFADLAQEQDAIRAALLAFVEGLLPAKADHAPASVQRPGLPIMVQCSELEGGHEEGDCPQDLDDDDEINGVPVGEIRALIANARETTAR